MLNRVTVGESRVRAPRGPSGVLALHLEASVDGLARPPARAIAPSCLAAHSSAGLEAKFRQPANRKPHRVVFLGSWRPVFRYPTSLLSSCICLAVVAVAV